MKRVIVAKEGIHVLVENTEEEKCIGVINVALCNQLEAMELPIEVVKKVEVDVIATVLAIGQCGVLERMKEPERCGFCKEELVEHGGAGFICDNPECECCPEVFKP